MTKTDMSSTKKDRIILPQVFPLLHLAL